MKAQLKVDGGDGDLPSISGISAPVNADSYGVEWTPTTWIALAVCIVFGFALPLIIIRNAARVKAMVVSLWEILKTRWKRSS
jgi:hypothetical protein